jgi:hypothetical protein
MMTGVMGVYIVSLFLNGCQKEVKPINDERVLKIREYLNKVKKYDLKTSLNGKCDESSTALSHGVYSADEIVWEMMRIFQRLDKDWVLSCTKWGGCVNHYIVFFLYCLIKEEVGTQIKEKIRKILGNITKNISKISKNEIQNNIGMLLDIENVNFNTDITLEEFKHLLIEGE